MAFLDEPTAGVDPEGRIAVRAVVAGPEGEGRLRRADHPRAGRGREDGRPHRDPVVRAHRARGDTRRADRRGRPAPHRSSPSGRRRASTPPRWRRPSAPGPWWPRRPPAATAVEGAAAAGPAATAAVATWLAERGAALTDLVAGRTLEDVYFEAVGAAAADAAADPAPEDSGAPAPSGVGLGAGAAAGGGNREHGRHRRRHPAPPHRPDRRRDLHDPAPRGDAAADPRHPRRLPALLLQGVGRLDAHAHAGEFFVPGILSLAVMSTAMVSLGIATGFERGYGVLKRLGATPLGRPRLLGAKIITIVAVELLQAAVLLPVGLALGWDPGRGGGAAVPAAIGAILLGSAAFAGIGLFMAGTLRAEVNLAAANGLYLILLLLGGMIVPITKLPSGLATFAKLLPAEALSAALHATLGAGRRCQRSPGPCSPSGPSPRRWRRRSRSAGNEGPLVGGEGRRREHGRRPRSWLMVPSPLTNTV